MAGILTSTSAGAIGVVDPFAVVTKV